MSKSTNIPQSEINALRAERYAYVVFSRLKDLIFIPQSPDSGMDYLIDIGLNGKPSMRFFGVETKGFSSGKFRIPANLVHSYKHSAFPVLLLIFDHKNDLGFYYWLVSPGKDGTLHLNIDNIHLPLSPLDTSAVKSIVATVKDWYKSRAGAKNAG